MRLWSGNSFGRRYNRVKERSMLPDPIELMEARAERMADEYFHDGIWHCCVCGRPIPPGHEETMSPDPAAAPVCRSCCERERKGEKDG
jgi:hypothetical protein